MYYYGLSGNEYGGDFCICYAESADGIHFPANDVKRFSEKEVVFANKA